MRRLHWYYINIVPFSFMCVLRKNKIQPENSLICKTKQVDILCMCVCVFARKEKIRSC